MVLSSNMSLFNYVWNVFNQDWERRDFKGAKERRWRHWQQDLAKHLKCANLQTHSWHLQQLSSIKNKQKQKKRIICQINAVISKFLFIKESWKHCIMVFTNTLLMILKIQLCHLILKIFKNIKLYIKLLLFHNITVFTVFLIKKVHFKCNLKHCFVQNWTK